LAINPKEVKQSIILVIFGLKAIIGFSQPPKELFRGRLMEGDNYGHPYTTFDRYNGDLCITLRSNSGGTLQGKFMKY